MNEKIKIFFFWLFNPTLGSFPILVMFMLNAFIPIYPALIIGIVCYIIYIYIGLKYFKGYRPYMLYTMGISLAVLCALSFLVEVTPLQFKYDSLAFETILVIALWMHHFLKNKTIAKLKEKVTPSTLLSISVSAEEFFTIANYYRIAFSCHLLILCICEFSPAIDETALTFLYSKLGFILVSIISLYELIRIIMLQSQILQEDWLPIVNEKGIVIGKIAYSVSKSTNKYLHPLIRVVLIHNNMFYLTQRPTDYIVDPGKFDYPFDSLVKYGQTLEQTIKETLDKNGCDMQDYSIKFGMKYIFKKEPIERLVYLYIASFNSPEIELQFDLTCGKWWTKKQIEENLGKGVFSEYFEKEYVVLKTFTTISPFTKSK